MCNYSCTLSLTNLKQMFWNHPELNMVTSPLWIYDHIFIALLENKHVAHSYPSQSTQPDHTFSISGSIYNFVHRSRKIYTKNEDNNKYLYSLKGTASLEAFFIKILPYRQQFVENISCFEKH